MAFTHIPRAQSPEGKGGRGTPAPPTNETKSTEGKTEMTNEWPFKFPGFSFEKGYETTIIGNLL